jgi:hypothetical protein
MKLLSLLSALLLSLPLMAKAAPTPEEPVGLSGWRVGFSNSLYLTAPANLKAGGVAWNISGVSFGATNWSAHNDSVRVEIARAPLAQFDALKRAAFASIGGAENSGQKISLDSYEGVRLAAGGKTALALRHAANSWAIVVAPGSAPDAAATCQKVLDSIWLERVGKPEWKDRVVGYSWQAELPYDLTETAGASAGNEYFRARWRDFSVETLKGGARTDFDKTIENQIQAFSNRTDIKDVRVQRFAREFGYLAKERGVALQIDFLRGTEPHRIYKISTVTGYGGLFTTISLKPKNPDHLAWAHRILSTLRLAYGVPGDSNKPIAVQNSPLTFESETAFRAPQQNGIIRSYIGNDERSFLFLVPQGDKPIMPLAGEMKDLGELTRDTMIANLLQGMGGKLKQATITPYAVGAFPARRVRFEANFGNNTLYGDALAVLPSDNIYLPLRITTTATNDFMPRVASTWRFQFPAPKDWKPRNLGGNFQALIPSSAKPSTNGDTTLYDFNSDGVKVHLEVKREAFPDEITLSLDGLTTGEKADNPMENDFGMLLRLRQRMGKNYAFNWARTAVGEAQGVVGWGAASDLAKMQDAIVLRTGTHSLLCEVVWNPEDKKSCVTRDALLGSLRCETGSVAEPPPSVPTAETDDGWNWWDE